MKRLFCLLLSIIILSTSLLSMVACGDQISDLEKHDCAGEYHFVLTKEDAGTCQRFGYKLYTCQTCGYSYRIINDIRGGHKLSNQMETVIPADVGKSGLKAYCCTEPGCNYWDAEAAEEIPPVSGTLPPI